MKQKCVKYIFWEVYQVFLWKLRTVLSPIFTPSPTIQCQGYFFHVTFLFSSNLGKKTVKCWRMLFTCVFFCFIYSEFRIRSCSTRRKDRIEHSNPTSYTFTNRLSVPSHSLKTETGSMISNPTGVQVVPSPQTSAITTQIWAIFCCSACPKYKHCAIFHCPAKFR